MFRFKRKFKPFYYCFSKPRTLVDLDSAKNDITQFKLKEDFSKYYLCKSRKKAKQFATFYGDGGTDIIIKIQILNYDEHNGYYNVSISTGDPQVIIPISGIRLMEYFHNAEELMR